MFFYVLQLKNKPRIEMNKNIKWMYKNIKSHTDDSRKPIMELKIVNISIWEF